GHHHLADGSPHAGPHQAPGPLALFELSEHDQAVVERTHGAGNRRPTLRVRRRFAESLGLKDRCDMKEKEANLAKLSLVNFRATSLRGFTLIELLAVIAIIAIIAGMVVSLAPGVNQNKRRQRVKVERESLGALIDNYQAKLGHYPPDNPNPAAGGLPAEAYDAYSQINPLLYELTGGTNNASQN